jgi:hypothetical protein
MISSTITRSVRARWDDDCRAARAVRALVSLTLAACGQPAAESSPAPEHLAFDGVYQSDDQNADGIREVAFANGEDYAAVAGDCADPSCVETGKYTFDAATKTLTFTTTKTGALTKIPIGAVHAEPTLSTGQSLFAAEDGSKLITGGEELTAKEKVTIQFRWPEIGTAFSCTGGKGKDCGSLFNKYLDGLVKKHAEFDMQRVNTVCNNETIIGKVAPSFGCK